MKLNLTNILISMSMTSQSAKMQAGKYIKKITGEKAPENGLVDSETVLAILDEINSSKTSKYKEQAKQMIELIANDEMEDSWSKATEKKEVVSDKVKIAEIKALAEENGYDDILEIINR